MKELRERLARSAAEMIEGRKDGEDEAAYTERVEKRRAFLTAVAGYKKLTISAGGALMAYKPPREPWVIATTRHALNILPYADLDTEKTARTLIDRLEAEILDPQGRPVPWQADDLAAQVKDWRDASGRGLKTR